VPVLQLTRPVTTAVSRLRLVLWLATTIVAGAVVMSLEMAAVRLFAPYFGYSIYAWGATICVVMAAMVAGYAVGGRLADAPSAETSLFAALVASAAWQLLALWTMGALLPRLAGLSDAAGVAAGACLLFAPSMIALAATGPVLVRLCADAGTVGRAAGLVYALSTAGSIAGTVATIFVLLPGVGTHATLKVLCASCVLVGAAGLVSLRRRRTVALAVAASLVMLVLAPGLGWSEGTVWTAESPYNLVRVVQSGGQWQLQLNHPTSVHTVRDTSGVWTGFYYDYFALGPLMVPARRALVLGMGAGGSIRSLRLTAPAIEIDAVEIDPRVVEAATRWFDVDRGDPRLRVHVMDARRFLARDRSVYDLVQLDVYQGGPYIPFHLVTEEFFRLARARMSDDALLMMNVFDSGGDHALLDRLAATLRRAFPSVLVGQTDAGNSMLFAFTRVPSPERLRNRPAVLKANAGVRDLALREAAPTEAPVFTDDLAPVEELTRRMLASR
jgi:predicted membrane-bound spermidine synthase